MKYVTGLQCHLCKAMFPAQALWVCDKCLGPLEVIYDYDKVRHDMSRAKIESRAKNLWRYRELLPIDGEPRTGLYSGIHAARQSRSAREEARRPRAVSERRLRQSSDVLVQGSRRLGCRDARRRAGVRRRSAAPRPAILPTAWRRTPRAWAAVLRVHSARSRGQQDSRLERLQPAGRRHQGQLRRCEPAVHADCGEVRLGLREHQSAQLLRRRRQDLRLRNRRAARLDISRSTSSRRLPAARCCRASRAHFAS